MSTEETIERHMTPGDCAHGVDPMDQCPKCEAETTGALQLKDGETILQIIADGLDASVDGRGFTGRHNKAVILANAAPAMYRLLNEERKALADYIERHPEHQDCHDCALCDGVLAGLDLAIAQVKNN